MKTSRLIRFGRPGLQVRIERARFQSRRNASKINRGFQPLYAPPDEKTFSYPAILSLP
jgi:hypothetical protein